tara:strand:- start:241 stop:456 length:216 start_codon:yes stop_codon:yes gene_type:complete
MINDLTIQFDGLWFTRCNGRLTVSLDGRDLQVVPESAYWNLCDSVESDALVTYEALRITSDELGQAFHAAV